jgi:cytochrome c peroxidase
MIRSWLCAIAAYVPFGRALPWICVGALLAGVAVARSWPDFKPLEANSEANSAADQEPITPIPSPPAADPLKIALGARLFADPRMSANGDFACSSCHDVGTNGAGGKAMSRTTDSPSRPRPSFDTPTVFNSALSFRLTWQGRFRSLATQAEASIESPNDMKSSVAEVVRKLNADPDTSNQFYAAYGRAPDRDELLDALVTFEQSLLTPGSRFDRWLNGDGSALSDEEIAGYHLFKSYGCSSCHQGVNVGGNLFQKQGVFRPLVATGPKIVRVPSLRNVAATAPYFHDGSALTLEDAVRRMAAAQLDRALTDHEVSLLAGFLTTLTGSYHGSPLVGASQ